MIRAQNDSNDTNTYPISKLVSQWHADKSLGSDTVVARFIKLNQKGFEFLGISVPYSDNYHSKSLVFYTSKYVGCIPLISPVSGKPYANLIVKGRFDEDLSDIIPVLSDSLSIEYNNEFKLPNHTTVRPPLYFECEKFIENYLIAQRQHWRKFLNEEKIQNRPSSSTNWGKYALTNSSPDKVFQYPNKVNLLTTNHLEWQQINYVLKICIEEIRSSRTPVYSRQAYSDKLQYLQGVLNAQQYVETNELRIHSSDPVAIKELKIVGNRILGSICSEYRAWRIDFNKVFEQYVQYVISKVSFGQHAILYNNHKLPISGYQNSWTLSYLEPDMIYRKGDRLIMVDAKYKTHLVNQNSANVSSLHESFRHDLHQILAYSAFDPTLQKSVLLVYPSMKFQSKCELIRTPLSSITVKVLLVGIPFGRHPKNDEDTITMDDNIRTAVNGIMELLNDKEE